MKSAPHKILDLIDIYFLSMYFFNRWNWENGGEIFNVISMRFLKLIKSEQLTIKFDFIDGIFMTDEIWVTNA